MPSETPRSTVCSIVALLLAGVAVATSLGTWTQPAVQLGTFTETFDGGGPGQAGNVLGATSSGGQWTLTNLVLQAPGATCNGTPGSDSHGAYLFDCVTQYAGGTMTVVPEASLWGDGFTASISGTNVSRHYVDGWLGFTFTGSGPTSHGGTVSVEATFLGPDTAQGNGHTGELATVTLTLTGLSVPTLGTAGLMILGFALLAAGALAALRMRA